MSRTGQGPHLARRKARYKAGKLDTRAVWVIRDGATEVSTGVATSPSQSQPPIEAKQALSDYITKHQHEAHTTDDIKAITCASVLLVYLDHKIDHDKPDEEKDADEREFEQRIYRLDAYFSGKMLAEVNTKLCKGYVSHRQKNGGGQGGARRDLEAFRAAINHHAKENLHRGNVSVWLPDKGEARERWLTRDEAAAAIWYAYRYREVQTIHVGPHKGEKVITGRRPLRHVARFMLMGCYTGTRAGSLAAAATTRAVGKAFVDLERGLFYRKPVGKKATNKRQPPAPIPPGLLAHMRRWVRVGIAKEHFVEWNGKPIQSVKKAFRTVIKGAEVDTTVASGGNVTPHTLRHTAATWLMQQGANLYTAAGYLGMSVEVLERNYGHHHPDYMADAVDKISKKTVKKKAAA
jgi:integrase